MNRRGQELAIHRSSVRERSSSFGDRRARGCRSGWRSVCLCGVWALLAGTTAAFGAEYYVNDSSAANDMYCSALGDDANSGLSPSTPKATVQAVIDAYDLAGGDIVYVDTGIYVLQSHIAIDGPDEGDSTDYVRFVGSTHADGSLVDGTALSDCRHVFHLSSGADYVSIERFKITGGEYGVFLENARSNRVQACELHGNDNGIRVGHSTDGLVVEHCRIHSNTGSGIYVNAGGSDNHIIRRNVVYGNGGSGVVLYICGAESVLNNAIVGNEYAGISLSDADGTALSNNIVVAGTPDQPCLGISTNTTGWTSDYNGLHATNGAVVGACWQTCSTLREWREATGADSYSISRDPLFVDARNGDYHLKSTAGSYHGGLWTADDADSPAIDMGYGDVGSEPAPNTTPLHDANRGRRNLGAYGGTSEASKTPAGRALVLCEPVGGASYLNQSAPIVVRWAWQGGGWQSNDTVKLEYSDDSGGSWTGMAGAGSLAVLAVTYDWDVGGLAASALYRARATCNQDANCTDVSVPDFRIGGPLNFYVNDGSVTNDVYCNAAGDNANNGADPSTPKASVQAVIDEYDLEPGDVVYVDTGTYVLGADIEIYPQDAGDSTKAVRFVGSTHADGSIIDRSNPPSGNGFSVYEADHVSIERFRITGAVYGVWVRARHVRVLDCELYGNSSGIRAVITDGFTVRGCQIHANWLYGAYVYGSLSAGSYLVENSLVYSNNQHGVYVARGNDGRILNNTICYNGYDGIYLSDADGLVMSNNIVVTDVAGKACIHVWDYIMPWTSDYNDLYATGGAAVGEYDGQRSETLAQWQATTGQDSNSLSRNPLFVHTGNADYHLKSTAGSYHGGAWTADAADSPCIDMACGDAGSEPAPNMTAFRGADRGRRNLGAYGGTSEGSKTPAARQLVLCGPVGGESYLNQAVPVPVRWTWIGAGWQSNDTVKLEYSDDSGGTWSGIAGAESVSVTNSMHTWDIGGLAGSVLYRVRATCNEDAGATDQSAADFRIGATLTYYVNDGSTANDVYCSAAGNDANSGLSPASPKATVQAVIDSYDLEPGDVVYVDTGLYVLSADIEIGEEDSGNATNHLRVVGSTHPDASVIDRNDHTSAAGFSILGGDYVSLERFKVTGGDYGVQVQNNSHHNSVLECEIYGNGDGVRFYGGTAESNVLRNCLIRENSDSGFLASFCGSASLLNNTICCNGSDAIRLQAAEATAISNNIVVVDVPDKACIKMEGYGVSLSSDYNDLYATGGAGVGWSNTMFGTLSQWQGMTAEDTHSISRDPLFVDAAGGDYHLRSTAGSYHGGAWTADAADSLGIDMGWGNAGEEPAPNTTPLCAANLGSRNLGAYGGTAEASKTPAGRAVLLRQPGGSEFYPNQAVPVDLEWAWIGQDWVGGDTLKLEYSDDSGATWYAIVGGEAVPVTDRMHSWDISGLAGGALYRVRITCNQDTNCLAASAADIRIGSTPLSFYVNDASVTNDVYCAGPGDDANHGATPASPKATIQAVIDAHNLEPGDVVYVDTGHYVLSADIVIGPQDEGNSTHYVTFVGSTHADGSVIDRADLSSGSGFRLTADYVSIETFMITGGQHGVSVEAAANGDRILACRIYGNGVGIQGSGDPFGGLGDLFVGACDIRSNTGGGVDLLDWDHCKVTNSLICGNGGSGISVSASGMEGCWATVLNNTICNNQCGVSLAYGYAGATLRNNIIVATNASGGGCISWDGLWGAVNSDYNDLYATNGAESGWTLAAWQAATGEDTHSISCDPLFVDAANGDYHLKSTAGSYHGGAWTADEVDSLAIDMGYGDAGDEPVPNTTPFRGADLGQRNLGAYGGVSEGSKTPEGRRLLLFAPLGGSYLETSVPVPLEWGWQGAGWTSNDTLKLEYSADSGGTWHGIAGGSAVSLTNATYAWDTSGLAPGVLYRVRITCNQDTNCTDASVSDFRIGGPLSFYVNDALTSNDVYCTAAGDDGNTGASASSPRRTVQSIIDSYDIEPGDIVYVDTGSYVLTNDIAIGAEDAGDATHYVRLVGSTHPAGSVINRNNLSSGRGFRLEGQASMDLGDTVKRVSIENFKVTGAECGAYVGNYVCNCRILRCEMYGNHYGIRVYGGETEDIVIRNNILYANTECGIDLPYCSYGSILNNTVYSDAGGDGIRLEHQGRPQIRNNIVWVGGAGKACIRLDRPMDTLQSDYNDLYATGGAGVGYSGTLLTTLGQWQTATGEDDWSVSLAPDFVDAQGGDYRLQSTSACIDAGMNAAWMFGATDIHGNPRIRNGIADMGACEFAHALQIQAWLQGAYDPATDQMGTLPGSNAPPTLSPYAADVIAVPGIPIAITDWVLIELRDTNGNPVVAKSALLREDGQVCGYDGNAEIVVNADKGQPYYVVLKHRNHLAAMSATPLPFTGSAIVHDFRAGPSQYYGGTNGCVELEPGVWGLIAGDSDGDGAVRPVDQTILDSQAALAGYHRGDLNLDGMVSDDDTNVRAANAGRASATPEPGIVLNPSLSVQPPHWTLLPGDGCRFTAAGASAAVHWAFALNSSGATLCPSNETAFYQAGVVPGAIDIVEAWCTNNLLGRAYVNVISLDDVAAAGKAVVLAGRKSADDPLWPNTDHLADTAFNTLLYRGYSKANVQYLSPVTNQDVDGNAELDDIDCETTYANTALTFTNWANNTSNLFVYLVDHGSDSSGNGYFRLNAAETLPAADLDGWLDQLQDTYQTKVTVLIDCCYAGSLLDELAYAGTAERVVIGSCGTNQPAYFVAGGLVSFSDAFFNGVLLGSDVAESYALATGAMGLYQTAAYYDNGGGALADGLYLGAASVTTKGIPRIGSVCGNLLLNGSTVAALWADDIASQDDIARVWCHIVPPSHDPDPAVPVADIPELELAYDQDAGRYQAQYDGFTEEGTYKVIYYARDEWYGVSLPEQRYVIQQGFDERVVLVNGGRTNSSEWTTMNQIANRAYHTLLKRWFEPASIYYLNADSDQDLNGDGTNDVDALPSLANLGFAISQWAGGTNWGGPADKLTVYLIGEEQAADLALNQSETLNAAALDGWLDAFQTSNQAPTIVIMEFARSGGFIPQLTAPGGCERISIASAAADGACIWSADGRLSFSGALLSHIFNGRSIGHAFVEARECMRWATGRLRQTAQLDDDGDGVPNEEAQDGVLAHLRYLGTAFMTGDDNPTIAAPMPHTHVPDTSIEVLIWAADITDMDGVSNVWCTITEPEYDGTGEVFRADLAWNADGNRHEFLYAELTNLGDYVVTFFADDALGELSEPKQSWVTRFVPDDDTDGDGMPNGWEVLYFLGVTNAEAETDSDGDTFNNWAEWLSGSDPTNAASRFEISDAQVPPVAGHTILSWPSVSNRIYMIDFTTNLVTVPFAPLVTNLVATPVENVYTDEVHAGEGQLYYRIRVGKE
ncbi:MAG: right-handed parallel beta-helix repeat-containing protein [Kiritimatiellae bacterium]|nr:right-handed parallel beta-helix repeat-containing protein [Kiritimatiellia bacterium]